MKSSSIFRANDIRGIYLKDFDLEFCKSLASSIGIFLKKDLGLKNPKVIVGRDARISSLEISKVLVEHLKSEGISIASLKIVPSPLVYFLTHYYDFDLGIVVTASHNPPEYNGFKFMVHEKYSFPSIMERLKDIWSVAAENGLEESKGQDIEVQAFEPYILSLKKEFNFSKKHKFVIDTGNGALGPLALKSLHALDLEPTILFSEPDGRFPNHHPDPTIEENLKDLKTCMKKMDADFGVGFDGDGDRLVVITKEGKTLLGDELASLLLPSLLKNKKEPLIVADVKCSDWFFKSIKDQGGRAIMTKSGHRLVRTEMLEKKAIAGFDFSGHFFLNDRSHRGFDDALYVLLRLIEIMESKNDLQSFWPEIQSCGTPEIRVSLSQKESMDVLGRIKKYLTANQESFVELDGVRVSRDYGWALFRSSQTEQALTMRFEAKTEQDLIELKKEFSQFFDFDL